MESMGHPTLNKTSAKILRQQLSLSSTTSTPSLFSTSSSTLSSSSSASSSSSLLACLNGGHDSNGDCACIQKKKKIMEPDDDECTFRPVINHRSSCRPNRGPVVMSDGALLHKLLHLQLATARHKEEAHAQETFQPQLNDVSSVRGVLRVTSESESYLSRMQQMEVQKQAHLTQKWQQQQAVLEQEARECTFQPETHAVPPFIQRIATSYQLIKLHNQVPTKRNHRVKPDWR